MANEASKTKLLWGAETLRLFDGSGIDIGCGASPIFPHARRFDKQHGDANEVSRYVDEKFDFVFASHCLEHMEDPRKTIHNWYSLVKPGGHLVVLVPDEDLYEQGIFPSLYNTDHKYTFTISKSKSWSPRSINLLDLANELEGEIVSLELQDHGLNRRLLRAHPGKVSRWVGRRIGSLMRRLRQGFVKTSLEKLASLLRLTVDQTNLNDHRLAQIQLIVQKPGSA